MTMTMAPLMLDKTDLSLKVGDAVTETQYRCQLTQAQLTPADSKSSGTTLDTFCSSFTSAGGLSVWTLDLAGFQAFQDAEDLSNVLFDNEAALASYLLVPAGGVISATNPGFKGQVTLKPVAIGGTAKEYALFTVSLPCQEKPVKLTTPEAVFAATAAF